MSQYVKKEETRVGSKKAELACQSTRQISKKASKVFQCIWFYEGSPLSLVFRNYVPRPPTSGKDLNARSTISRSRYVKFITLILSFVKHFVSSNKEGRIPAARLSLCIRLNNASPRIWNDTGPAITLETVWAADSQYRCGETTGWSCFMLLNKYGYLIEYAFKHLFW